MLNNCLRENLRINNRELTAASAHCMGFKHKLNLSILTYKSLGHIFIIIPCVMYSGPTQWQPVAACATCCVLC